jgi:hypothetical protein
MLRIIMSSILRCRSGRDLPVHGRLLSGGLREGAILTGESIEEAGGTQVDRLPYREAV